MPAIEPQTIDAATRDALEGVTTATLTTVLLKKGLRNVWIRGALPLAERLPARRVGRAFTLRFVPAREDLATPASWASPISTRTAIEAMPAGAIAVVDAMGTVDAGIFGDILCARMAGAMSPRSSPTASSAISAASSAPASRSGAAARRRRRR
jgi:regulator of RNase E activity RraA